MVIHQMILVVSRGSGADDSHIFFVPEVFYGRRLYDITPNTQKGSCSFFHCRSGVRDGCPLQKRILEQAQLKLEICGKSSDVRGIDYAISPSICREVGSEKKAKSFNKKEQKV
jgi:hypothetical protein